MVKVEILGESAFQQALRKITNKKLALLNEAIEDSAQLVHSEVVKSLRNPGAGKTYGRHVASAPGKPPATDTGNLIGHVFFESSKEEGLVISKAEYSAALEFGTKNIRARPFMGPALKNNTRKIQLLMIKALGK